MKKRVKSQYVVVRSNGNSGSFVVANDGTVTESFFADSMFSVPAWHETDNACQCGDQAVTVGHFTNRRQAEVACRRANKEEL